MKRTGIGLIASLAVLGLEGTALAQNPTLEIAIFTQQQANWLNAAAKRCNTNIRVSVTASVAHHDRLRIALQSGGAGAPDIAGIEQGFIGSFFRGGGDAGLLELGPWVQSIGAGNNLVAARNALYSSGGKLYAIDMAMAPVVLYYRADMWEAAGVDPNNLRTWDEFIEASKKVQARNPGVITMPIYPNLLQVLMRQQSVDMFDEKGDTMLDSPTAIRTQQWLLDRIKDGTGAPNAGNLGSALAPEDYAQLRSNKWASIVGADWYLTSMSLNVPELAGKWRAARLPAWSQNGRRTSVFGGTGMAIPKTGKNIEAAQRFLQCAALNIEGNLEKWEVQGAWPSWRAAWNDPRLQQPVAYLGNQRIGQLFRDLSGRLPTQYASPYRLRALELYMAGLRNLYDGKINAEQHLKAVADGIRTEQKRDGR
jgi:arabinosaccharide transport system substrate-binding protein